MTEDDARLTVEIQRINAEYARRDLEIDPDLYAPWQPAEILAVSERQRTAALILKRAGKFPVRGDRCLEIGYGKLGWLGSLISWGLCDSDLYGIELDGKKACVAKEALKGASLEVGNAADLPWEDNYFRFVIASTVFSSILDERVRNLIAKEMDRVLAPGGVIIWYDIAINNYKNKNIKRISKKDLEAMFPNFDRRIQPITLAPPIARRIATWSWPLATVLSSVPFLRSHLLAVLIKR